MGQKVSTAGDVDVDVDVDGMRQMLNLIHMEQGLRQHPAGKRSQADHAWDPNDRSPNFTLTQNNRVATKSSSGASVNFTDMVRGKQGYTNGTHIWEITWKQQHRGSHAVIGVASYQAPLKCLGHSALLGSDDESLGWNIVSNVSLFNDCVINKYPDGVQPGFHAPDVIRVILNMDEGTLRFKSGVDDQDYGLCLGGLRAFSRNGQKLYPAISATKQDAQIEIKYLGSTEPICGSVGVAAGISGGPLVFHSEVGANIQLSNGRRTATRIRGVDNGVVMSNRPLKDGEYFEVTLNKRALLPTKYSMDIGVTTNAPEKLNFPETMTDCTIGQTWMFCEERVVRNKVKIESFAKINLSDLKEGSTVGLMRTSEGQLHIFLDGRLKAKCKLNIPANVYAVVDLYGKACETTITAKTGVMQKKEGGTPSARTCPRDQGPSSSGDSAPAPPPTTAAKSTVEIITENVQATITLMKQKDPRTVSKVLTALQNNILKVSSGLGNENHRHMLIKLFNDMGGAIVLVDFMMFLKDAGVEHDEVFLCFMECINILLFMTHTSLNFTSNLGGTGIFAMLVKEADKFIPCYKSNQNNTKRVVYALAILHNCSKATSNVALLRQAGAKEMLTKYCDPVTHDSDIAFVALLTLVNIMVGFEIESLKVHDNLLAMIVKNTNSSVANTTGRLVQVKFRSADCSVALHSTELVAVITKLSQNPTCRTLLVKNNVIKHLIRLMEVGDQTEQELACNAVWELMSEQTVSDIMMTPRMTDVVQNLSKTRVNEVANAANRVIVKIKLVLKRSSVGEMTVQVLPDRSTVPSECEYKQACQRYLLHLKIQDSVWDKTWHLCYCRDCHAAKEDCNYYTRGNPPKEYGIPLGWHRFGIEVLKRNKQYFTTWHRAFHGTKVDKVAKILDIGELVMPGDKIRGGDNIKVEDGHFTEERSPKGFNIRQVFVSPSIRYAGHHAYAKPTKYVDPLNGTTYNSQVAFQVLISPGSYKVGKETVGANHKIDPKFSNQELEWSTDERGSTILYGLLVKLDKVDSSEVKATAPCQQMV